MRAILPIAQKLGLIAQTWASRLVGEAGTEVMHAAEILDVVERLAPSPAVSDLLGGVTENDPRALNALADLASVLTQDLAPQFGRLIALRDAGQWSVLREECELTAQIAAAVGAMDTLASTRLLLALAQRRAGNVIGAISAYRAAIDAGVAAGPAMAHTCAIAYDNLGNVLAEVGRLDEALASYNSALPFEDQPDGRRSILGNKANVLADLGEFRAATDLHSEIIAELEHVSTGPRRMAIALDDAGQVVRYLGDLDRAEEMLGRARQMLPDGDLDVRAVNALLLSDVGRDRHDDAAAAEAFTQAHDLEVARAREEIDAERYRAGYANARQNAIPVSEAATLLFTAVQIPPLQTAHPLTPLIEAAATARSRGDLALALRLDANRAGRLLGAGAGDRAAELAWQIQAEANQRGLAYPESASLGILGTLCAQGVDVSFPLGPLSAYIRATVLFELHLELVAEAKLEVDPARFETLTTGFLDNELAKFAVERRAYGLATSCFERAVAHARAQGLGEQLLNRLSGLAGAKANAGDAAGAAAVDAEISKILSEGPAPPRGEIAARRGLAARLASVDRPAAIEHLQRAVALGEQMRATAPRGAARAEVAREFAGLSGVLASLLHQEGSQQAAFDALQGDKARRTLAVLADLHGGDDRPATAQEIGGLLAEDSLLIDIAMRQDGITAYLVSPGGEVSAVDVDGDANELLVERGDIRDRQSRLVRCALESPLLHELAAKLTDASRAGSSLFLVPDGPLHSLPVHATPASGRPWYEQSPVAQLPAAGMLRFRCAQRGEQPRSFVAGDSRGDLPYAALEVQTVADMLGCTPRIGATCTRAALEQALGDGGLDVVHLAVHGRGDAQRGGRASLLFATDEGIEWVPFDDLTTLRWDARLVVFSGCSTAVTGPRQGIELVGVARAALEAGAGAVIASLWPVGDQPAKIMVAAFYKSLLQRLASGDTDIRLALDDARTALRTWLGDAPAGPHRPRDGRDLLAEEAGGTTAPPSYPPAIAQALEWAPFVLIGNPIWQATA